MTEELELPKKKRKKPVSATKRALAECRKRGWVAQVVEQTIPRVFIKRDLFGVIDIIALTPDGIVGIQATAGDGHHTEHLRKIYAEPRAKLWLEVGAGRATIELWTFLLRGASGKRKLFTLRTEAITLGGFPETFPSAEALA
jgi:hypothetical protein